MFFFIFKKYVVEELRAHVLWSGQFVLLQALKQKGGSVINKFKGKSFILVAEKDIFSFDIWMNNLIPG